MILATETTGDYVQNITGGTGIDSTGATSGENIAHTLSIDLNELATETSIADNDFIAMVDATDSASGKITFENLEDAIFASVSGDIAIAEDGAATIQANSVAMATDTTGDFVNSITAGTGITSTGATSGENISHSLSIDAAQTGITSLLATDIKIGEDNETKIDFEDADKINFYAGNEKQLILEDGALYPGSDNIIDLGKSDNEFKDGFFDGTVTADAFAGPLTGNADTATLSTTVTVSDSSANTNFPVVFHNESNGLLDDTGALRYNPSTGELLVPKLTVAGATTTVDTVTMNAANAIIFEGATADSNETTLSIVDPTSDHTQYLINQGGYIPVLAASTTTAITSTPEELNILDGVTSTASELNILDGVTSTTAELNILDGVTSTTAELNILDGVTASAADINLIDGITNGTVIASKAIITDSNKDISGGRNITISGELDAATLDISGDADIDGTLEADAYTVNGTALDEFISDTVGAMVGSNTETGIAVTYDDSDNTLDFVLGASQTSLTSLLNASLVAGRDADNQIKFSTDDQIIFRVAGGDGVTMKASGEIEATSLDISGDIDVDGTTNLDVVDIDGAVDMASTLAVGGVTTLSDALDMQDNNKILLGTGDDLEIYFDGTNTVIDHTPNAGQMFIRADQIAVDDSGGSGPHSPKNYFTLYEGSGAVFNEDGEAAHDFRVETSGNTHGFFIDAGNNVVNINAPLSSDTQSTPEEVLALKTFYSNAGGTDGAAGAGSLLTFYIPDDETNPAKGAGIAGLRESGDDSNMNSALAFYTSGNDVNISEKGRFDSNGFFAVGSTDPSCLLHLESDEIDPTLKIINKTVAAINTGPDIEFWNNPFTSGTTNAYESGAIRVRKTNGSNNNHDHYMSFEVRKNSPEGINEAMRITSDGNVGINTANPIRPLGVSYGVAKTNTNTAYAMSIQSNESSGQAALQFYAVGGASAAVRKWQLQTTEVGVANAGEIELQPDGGKVTSKGIYFTGNFLDGNDTGISSSGDGGDLLLFTNGSAHARLDSLGRFVIGTTSANAKLHIHESTDGQELIFLNHSVTGSNQTYLQFRHDGSLRGSIIVNDSTDQIVYNTTSDERVKENIVEVNDALSIINKIPVKQFNFIGNEQKTPVIGYIGQELIKEYPQAVTITKTDDFDDYHMVDESKMVAVLMKSVQELSAKVNELEKKCNCA